MIPRSISVSKQNRFFRQLATAQISTAALLASFTGGSKSAGVTQICFAKPLEIEFSAAETFKSIAKIGDWPTSIELTVYESSGAPDPTASLTAIQVILASIYEQAFLSYFENIRPLIDSRFGQISNWPSVLDFARVLRNAFAHGGTIDIRDHSKVSWGTVKYSESDNGRQVLYNDLSAGDLTLLMLEVDDEV